MAVFTSLNESIIPLDSTKYPKKPTKQRLNYEDVWSYLYQLNGINIIIQTRDSYFGKNTFQSQGKGGEIALVPYSASSSAQRFHLRFPSGTSGIPYLIYSSLEQKPIGAGTYASNPSHHVLYTPSATNTNLYGFSWDFLLNSGKNGYFFENQDVLEQGPGGWWDVYNKVLNIYNGVITFNKRNDSFAQQLNIMPDDDFIIQGVDVTLDGAEILSTAPSALREGTVDNYTQTPMQRTLAFSESKTDGISFSETLGITTRKSGSASISLKLGNVVTIGGSHTIELGTSETIQYGQSSSRTVGFTESFTITVPPGYRSVYSFKALKHSVKLGYTARLLGVNTAKQLNIGGVYSGVDYSSTHLEVREEPLAATALAGAVERTYKVYPNK